jgi:PST family polysaccharide transporter
MRLGNFARQLVSGVAYTAIAKYIGLFVSLAVTAILSRLLLPNDFGIVAIATIFINFFSLISTMGISPAIIQNKILTDKDIQHIYTFTFYLGIVLSCVFLLLIPLIVLIYRSDLLIPVLSILTINIFFSTLNIVPNALLFKNKEFKYIALRTLLVQISIGIVAIIGATAGLGIYALLVNPVLGSIILYMITYRRYPVSFHLRFQKMSIDKIYTYSLYQILFNIIVLFYNSIDKLVIGRFLGVTALGYYEKSYRLMQLPLENVGHVISPVLQPLLSEHQNDIPFILTKYYSLITFLAYIGFVLSAFLFFTAKELIILIFGDQWIYSIESFRILSVAVGFIIIQSPVGSIFQSVNYTKGLFISSLYAAFVIVVAVAAGLLLGTIEWVSVCLVPSFIFILFIYNYILHKHVLKTPFWNFVKLLIRPFLMGFLTALLLGALSHFVHINSLLISLCIKGCILMFIISCFYKLKLFGNYTMRLYC